MASKLDDLEKTIREIREEERERCAKVAEAQSLEATPKEIAAAIRNKE